MGGEVWDCGSWGVRCGLGWAGGVRFRIGGENLAWSGIGGEEWSGLGC